MKLGIRQPFRMFGDTSHRPLYTLTSNYFYYTLVELPKKPYTRFLHRRVVTPHFCYNVAHRAIQSLWWRVWVLQVVTQAVGAKDELLL